MEPIAYSLFFDFHNAAQARDVGADFDAEPFAEQIKSCHVNFLTFHARCNQGHAYYPTKIGKPHPSLTTDIVGGLARACRARGIQLSVYFNGHLSDEELIDHPEWREKNVTARDPEARGPFYRSACYNNEAYRAHLLGMAKEVLEWYDVDGFFFDCLLPSDCVCPACLARMAERGIDSRDAEALRRFSDESCQEFSRMLHDELAAIKPNLRFFFNGRPFRNMAGMDTQWEGECLPTVCKGGGYDLQPLLAHYLRTLDGGRKQVLNMTCRFNDWGDFGSLRTMESLEYDMFYGIANGMRPDVGDHLPPRGAWPKPVYERIRELYGKLGQYDRWSLFAENRPEVAVVYPPKCRYHWFPNGESLKGAARMLTELNVQFDIVTEASAWDKYRLLVFPDDVEFTPEIAARVSSHLAKGGKVLATGASGLLPSGEGFALPEAWPAVHCGGMPYTPVYFQPQGAFAEGLPDMPLSFDAGCEEVTASSGAEVCMRCVKPVCRKGWDGKRTNYYVAPDCSPEAGAGEPFVLRKGGMVYVAGHLFEGYFKSAKKEDRLLVGNVIGELDGTPLLRTAKMPSFARAFVQFKEGMRMVHLLTYCLEKRLNSVEIEDRPVMLGAELSLRTDGRTVGKVYLAPGGEALPFVEADGYCTVTVPQVEGYGLVVFE